MTKNFISETNSINNYFVYALHVIIFFLQCNSVGHVSVWNNGFTQIRYIRLLSIQMVSWRFHVNETISSYRRKTTDGHTLNGTCISVNSFMMKLNQNKRPMDHIAHWRNSSNQLTHRRMIWPFYNVD